MEALESSRAYSTLSLSERSGDGDEDGADPLELLGEEDDGYGLVEQRQLLREGFRGLPERERAILHMRFFLGLTQSEIADRVGISQMHVSRLIRQSLERVRADLAAAEPEQPVRNRPCADGTRRRVKQGRKRTTRSRPSA